MSTDLIPQDYARRITNEVSTVKIDDVDISYVRSLNCFWHHGGYVTHQGMDDRLCCEGDITVINPDHEAVISAIHLQLGNVNVEFYRDRQTLEKGGWISALIFPRDEKTLTEEANGAFRHLIDRQIPNAYYKTLNSTERRLANTMYMDHRRVLSGMEIAVGEYGLYLALVLNSDPGQLTPIRELCDAPAVSTNPQLRHATCKFIALAFRQSMKGLAGVEAHKLLSSGSDNLVQLEGLDR